MKNNYLVLVTTNTLAAKLKEKSNVTFLFPLSGFCVGFPKTFELAEIKEEGAYIFVNRILDNEGIEKLKDILLRLPFNIKGIVFDDLGVLQVLKTNKTLEKILFLNHFNCNYKSINAYLDYVDSVVVSTDITADEVKEILVEAKKPLVLYTFGHVNIMYSRRLLITNYNNHFKREAKMISSLTNDLHEKFFIVENNYGTVIYTDLPFNGLRYRDYPNVLYHLINTVFLNDEEVLAIINSSTDLALKYPYQYLSQKKTITRVKERV